MFSDNVISLYVGSAFYKVLLNHIFIAEFSTRTSFLKLTERETEYLIACVSDAAEVQREQPTSKAVAYFNKRMLGQDSTEGSLLRKLSLGAKPERQSRVANQFVHDLATIAANLM